MERSPLFGRRTPHSRLRRQREVLTVNSTTARCPRPLPSHTATLPLPPSPARPHPGIAPVDRALSLFSRVSRPPSRGLCTLSSRSPIATPHSCPRLSHLSRRRDRSAEVDSQATRGTDPDGRPSWFRSSPGLCNRLSRLETREGLGAVQDWGKTPPWLGLQGIKGRQSRGSGAGYYTPLGWTMRGPRMWGVKTARALASIRKSAHRVTTIMYIRGTP